MTMTQLQEPACETSAQPGCPKCGGKLINPETLGWCLSCGYCQSAEANQGVLQTLAQQDSRRDAPSFLGIHEFFQLVLKLPTWVISSLGCLLGFGIVAYLARDLTAAESYARAVWCASQLALGCIILFCAQLWSLAVLSPRDDKLGARDALVPFRLWQLTCSALPATVGPFLVGVCGFACLVSALTFVEALGYWLPKA